MTNRLKNLVPLENSLVDIGLDNRQPYIQVKAINRDDSRGRILADFLVYDVGDHENALALLDKLQSVLSNERHSEEYANEAFIMQISKENVHIESMLEGVSLEGHFSIEEIKAAVSDYKRSIEAHQNKKRPKS